METHNQFSELFSSVMGAISALPNRNADCLKVLDSYLLKINEKKLDEANNIRNIIGLKPKLPLFRAGLFLIL